MTDRELLDEVRRMRAAGMTPKGIARTLGVRPAVIAPLVRRAAEEAAAITAAITFGRDGRPLYVAGPYDDPIAVMETLQAAVGSDGFAVAA
jgi:hypothetical protein